MQTEAEAPATEPLSSESHAAVPEGHALSRASTSSVRQRRGAGRGRAVGLRQVDAARADGGPPGAGRGHGLRARARRTRPSAAPPAPTCRSATCSSPGATRSRTPPWRSSARACRAAEARRRAEPLFERFGLAEFEHARAGRAVRRDAPARGLPAHAPPRPAGAAARRALRRARLDHARRRCSAGSPRRWRRSRARSCS